MKRLLPPNTTFRILLIFSPKININIQHYSVYLYETHRLQLLVSGGFLIIPYCWYYQYGIIILFEQVFGNSEHLLLSYPIILSISARIRLSSYRCGLVTSCRWALRSSFRKSDECSSMTLCVGFSWSIERNQFALILCFFANILDFR